MREPKGKEGEPPSGLIVINPLAPNKNTYALFVFIYAIYQLELFKHIIVSLYGCMVAGFCPILICQDCISLPLPTTRLSDLL